MKLQSTSSMLSYYQKKIKDRYTLECKESCNTVLQKTKTVLGGCSSVSEPLTLKLGPPLIISKQAERRTDNFQQWFITVV